MRSTLFPQSTNKRPTGNKVLLTLDISKFSLNRLVGHLDFGFNRWHFLSPLINLIPVHILEPFMLLNRLRIILKPQPFLRILSQKFFYQVPEHFRTVLREANHSLTHFLVQLRFGLCVEWRNTSQEFV